MSKQQTQILKPPSFFPEQYGSRVGQKHGGAHDPDPDGGIFKNGVDTFLIKRDAEKPQNDIAEYLASKVFGVLAPNSGAEVDLVQSNKVDDIGKSKKETFLVSKFFKNYQDLYQVTGDSDRHPLKELLEAEFLGKQTVKNIFLAKNTDGDFKYQGYAKAIILSILLNDFSLHSGNIGVVNGKELVRVDFGAAFRGFDPELHPFKSINSSLGIEKNYFLRDHPKERYKNAEFVEEAHRMADVDLVQVIRESWQKIEKSYTPKDRQAFCKQIGMADKAPSSARVQDYLITRMGERQESLKRFAKEITKEMAKEKLDIIEKTAKLAAHNKAVLPKDVELIEITNKVPKTEELTKTASKSLEKGLHHIEDLSPDDLNALADARRSARKRGAVTPLGKDPKITNELHAPAAKKSNILGH